MTYIDCTRLITMVLTRDAEDIAAHLRVRDFDPAVFKQYLITNELLYVLYSFENKLDLKKYFPDASRNEMRALYIRQMGFNEALAFQMQRLNDIFRSAAAEVIFLKGFLLFERYYPPGFRRRGMHDIDILIHPEDFEAIDGLLVKSGCIRADPLPRARRFTMLAGHHVSYRYGGVVVELHWDIVRHFSFHIDYQRLWSQRRLVHFRDHDYYALSDEYFLVVQILSIFGDLERGFVKAKSFVDLFMMLKSISHQFDWESFFCQRRQEGVYRIAFNVLDASVSLFGWESFFPSLTKFLKNNAIAAVFPDSVQREKLFTPSSFGIYKKRWTFRLYQTHVVLAVLWWFLTLPLRIVMHGRDFTNRCRMLAQACAISNDYGKVFFRAASLLGTTVRCALYLLCLPCGGTLMRHRDAVIFFDALVRFSARLRNDFFFIQVGSCDGVKDDPIHEYVREFRWSGILIEPVPYLFRRLRQNYSCAQNLIFANVAISDSIGHKDFFYIKETSDLIPDWYDEIGSLSQDIVLGYRRTFPSVERHISRMVVGTTTLQELIRQHHVRQIDLLHIDAEGHDGVILRTVDFNNYAPGIILYEHSHLSAQENDACRQLLHTQGYRLVAMGRDTCAWRYASVRRGEFFFYLFKILWSRLMDRRTLLERNGSAREDFRQERDA